MRYKTLGKMLNLAKCVNVTTQQADFLDADPLAPQWANVRRMWDFCTSYPSSSNPATTAFWILAAPGQVLSIVSTT